MGEQKLVITNDEKIIILNQRISNFKEQIKDKNTFTYSLYSSNSPKKDHLRAWAEALEDLHTLGAYKADICTISTHIRRELISLGVPQAIETAKKALPLKYKDTAKIHADTLLALELREMRGNQYPEKVKSKEEITAINKIYINELEEDIKLLEKARDYLFTHELVSKLDPYELDEFFTRKRGTRKLLHQAMDGRTKVITETFNIMMHAHIEATKSDTFAKYMKHIKELLDLTPKQAVKLLTGRVSKVDILYEPKTRRDARYANFYGIQCGECGSWRQEIKYDPDLKEDKLFCYACRNWNELKTERLLSKMI